MAVVAPPPFQSKPDCWAAGTATSHTAQASEQMTDLMSYQYPPPPPTNGVDMALPPPGYISADYSSIHPPHRLVQEPGISPKDRHSSLASKSLNMKLARSLSTPPIQPSVQPAMSQQHISLSQDQNALSLAAEKRRNKLGYHRTSVACGHCRRRKIRCIPSTTDVQGRCANCIRLKKDCNFYPVDQQPPTESRKNSASRTSAMAPPVMKAPGIEKFSTEPKLAPSTLTGRAFEYSHNGMATNWMAADATPSSTKAGDMNAAWRPYSQESPIAAAFSPYTQHTAPPAPTAWTPQSEPAGRDDMGWSYPAPPPRSLSFGADALPNHQTAYPSISQMTSGLPSRSFDRKHGSMSDMYTSPITTTIPGVDSIPGTTLDHAVSLPAGATGASTYAGWQPYSYSKPSVPSDAYIGWGGDHTTSATETHPVSSGMYYTGR